MTDGAGAGGIADPQLRAMFDAARADLTAIDDDIRWAFTNGYWPTTSRERGTSLGRPEHERDSGPRFDFAIADHRSREAYRATLRRLAQAEAHFDLAVLNAYATTGRLERQQPALILNVVPAPAARPQLRKADATVDELTAAVRAIRWRVDLLHTDIANDVDLGRSSMKETLRGAKALERCASALAFALNRGKTHIGDDIPRCTTCRIRPRRQWHGRVIGKECSTCHSWRHLHHGRPRPRKLDQAPLKAAREAQQRRRERGEGWGAA